MSTPATPLRVLLVEDNEDDARLVLRELTRAGYAPASVRVDTEAALRHELTQDWSVVLCDYSMPALDAVRALGIVRELEVDIPFIVVSGTIGEETAVAVMRLGAHDYLLKDNLRRLGPAVAREIREAEARKARRHADEVRKQAEASFRLIVERTPDLVVVHRDDRILYVNPMTIATLGYSDASLVGQPLSTVIIEEDHRPGEQRWRTKSGEPITCDVVHQSVVFEGEPANVSIARDSTQRNQVATAMIEMDRMAAVGVLAAGVGHEINNPLAYVLANLEYLSTEIETILAEVPKATLTRINDRVVDLRQALKDTNEGARRVRDIVTDLRTFSRGDDEKVGMVDARHVLDSSLRMAAAQVRPHATVKKSYGDIPYVLANESRLGQVFLNLLVNAVQALPEGRAEENTITLSTGFEGGHVVVSVSDTGSGIAREVLPRIFDPFFTTKPDGRGTGLGLSISRRIVNALRGKIEVKTSSKGTTFVVHLPPADAVAAEAPPRVTRPSTAPPRRGRILCVDDEPAIGTALRRVLLGEHDVLVLTSAAKARERVLDGENFDVVLCDLMMPGMSGMELHAEFMKHAPDLAQRMIFLTGGAFTAQAREFLERIPNSRLEKPIGIDQLRANISALIAGVGSA